MVQGAVEKVAGPKDLFQALYHHFLCLADTGLQLEAPVTRGTPGAAGPAPSVAAGVQGDAEAERILCIRAMAAVYANHAGLIGKWQSP